MPSVRRRLPLRASRRVRLLEQHLPAHEKLRELVAGGSVRGRGRPCSSSRPASFASSSAIRRLRRRDLRLEALELRRRARGSGRAASPARTASSRLRLGLFGCGGARFARAPCRPSRRRTSGARRPRWRRSGRGPRRAARGRARRSASSPGTPRARPRAPPGSRGRGGSSARRGRGSSRPTRRAARARAASARRPRARSPRARASPSRRRGSGRAASAPAGAAALSRPPSRRAPTPASGSSCVCCEKYPGTTPCPRRDRPAVERMAVEDRLEQRRLARSRSARRARPSRRARRRSSRRRAAACRRPRARCPRPRGRSGRSAAGRRKSKPSVRRLRRERLELLPRRRALLLEPADLGELRLRLLRLRLLVAEARDEALEPRDVLRDAVGGLPGRGRARRLLPPPLVPRAGEVVRACRGRARAPRS